MLIELRSEDNVTEDGVRDDRGVLARLLPAVDDERYPYLRLVDPYGDTVFSHVQMAVVLPELRSLVAAAGDSVRDDPVVRRLLAMAERCARDVHTYLVFEGD